MDTRKEKLIVCAELAYKGAVFFGFARQTQKLTVQGNLEEALCLLFGRQVLTVCAGRTDAGVHAREQVISFELRTAEWQQRSCDKLLRSLNALTHEDISVRSLELAEEGFSARFSATMREYRYFICTDSAVPVFMRDFSWHLSRELDVEAMRRAAAFLVGEHDFKSFCVSASAEGKSTMRFVENIDITSESLFGENLLVIRVAGNAFLHSMVRTIVGTLVAVGLGKREWQWMGEVLEARKRSAAGQTAPAQGLVLWQVSYTGERRH